MSLGAFGITRIVIFGALLVFALGALALGASITAGLTSLNDGFSVSWTPGYFGIAVGAITIVTVIPLIVIDLINKLSLVTVELVAIGILWVLWLAAAAYLTSDLTINNCDGIDARYYPRLSSLCHQYQGYQAFCWLAWLLLTAYLIILLTLSIMASAKGHKRVWLSSSSNLSYSPQRLDGQQQHMMANTSSYNSTPYGATPAPVTPGGYGAPYQQQQQPNMMMQQQPQQPNMMMQQQPQQPQMMMMQQQHTGGGYAQNYVPPPGVAQV